MCFFLVFFFVSEELLFLYGSFFPVSSLIAYFLSLLWILLNYNDSETSLFSRQLSIGHRICKWQYGMLTTNRMRPNGIDDNLHSPVKLRIYGKPFGDPPLQTGQKLIFNNVYFCRVLCWVCVSVCFPDYIQLHMSIAQ